MKTLLVCFSGVDGSGKTTLCKGVVNELRSRKIPSRYVYGRFLPVVVAPVFKVISTLISRKGDQQELRYDRSEIKRHLLRNPILFKLFWIGILVDQSLRILLKVYLPSILTKKVIICDRYLLDTVIIDIALDCGLSRYEITRLLQQCLPIFPQADLVFVMNVPPRIAFQRKSDIYSIQVLEHLSNMYLSIGKEFGAIIIDGTRNPSELKQQVLCKLKSVGIPLSL